MSEFNEIKRSLPPETQEFVERSWKSIPPEEQSRLTKIMDEIPLDQGIRQLLRSAATNFRLAFGTKSKVAIVGPANVGKSTLYNQMVLSKSDRALVSPIPGTTRANQTADAGVFTVVDTPGADAVGEVGETERHLALNAASQADVLIIMFDAIQGIKKTELDLFTDLSDLNKPFVVVVNKIDLVRRESPELLKKAAANLHLDESQVIGISAQTGKNLDKVLLALVAIQPSITAAIGQALPGYRRILAQRLMVSSASLSAAIALTPLPIIDFAPLIVTQSTMVLGIARIYRYRITLVRARELIATFGLGFLARSLFQELSKFGGIPGWLLSAAIASSTTYVMGYAARIWFENGDRISNERLNEMTRHLTQDALDRFKHLWQKKKPDEEHLKEGVNQFFGEIKIDAQPDETIPDK